MLAFGGRMWWKKPEEEETTDLGQATTTLPHVDARDQTRVAALTGKDVTPMLSRPYVF